VDPAARPAAPAVRPATGADVPAILAIDAVTWAPANSPAPPPDPGGDPLGGGSGSASTVLVADRAGAVLGWIRLQPPGRNPSSAHVRLINGLAVDPSAQRQGVARALLDGAIAQAQRDGVRRLRLRVLATNPGARALYERAGFRVEGILAGEFVIDGVPVDDVLMALTVG
jgi:ribosomal protein S18 acetylase RimI-like enzyme